MTRTLSASCIAVLALAPVVSSAAGLPAVFASNPAGVCQGALPQFAGTLRARPFGLGNEGESTAFVTCSLPHAEMPVAPTNGVSENATAVSITVANGGTATITVSCTFVHGSGFTGGANTRYVTRSQLLAPNNSFEFSLTSSDVTLPGQLVSPNFSCSLPPGGTVVRVSKSYLRNTGF